MKDKIKKVLSTIPGLVIALVAVVLSGAFAFIIFYALVDLQAGIIALLIGFGGIMAVLLFMIYKKNRDGF